MEALSERFVRNSPSPSPSSTFKLSKADVHAVRLHTLSLPQHTHTLHLSFSLLNFLLFSSRPSPFLFSCPTRSPRSDCTPSSFPRSSSSDFRARLSRHLRASHAALPITLPLFRPPPLAKKLFALFLSKRTLTSRRTIGVSVDNTDSFDAFEHNSAFTACYRGASFFYVQCSFRLASSAGLKINGAWRA